MRSFRLITLGVALCTILGCTPTSLTGPIATPRIEEASTFNEAYRDSILMMNYYGMSIVHKSGSGMRLITSEHPVNAVWSPMKSKIVYTVWDSIKVMDADGSNPRTIAKVLDPVQYAIPSRDGLTIAFVTVDTTDPLRDTGSIGLMNADGTNARRLITLHPVPNRLSWTADGKRVVYNSRNSTGHTLCWLPVDNPEPEVILQMYRGFCSFPSVSPDGRYVAFSGTVDTADKILFLDLQTRTVIQKTFGSSLDQQPSWSGDGMGLVYARAEPNGPYLWLGSSVWTLDVATGMIERISPVGFLDYWYPCWQQ